MESKEAYFIISRAADAVLRNKFGSPGDVGNAIRAELELRKNELSSIDLNNYKENAGYQKRCLVPKETYNEYLAYFKNERIVSKAIAVITYELVLKSL